MLSSNINISFGYIKRNCLSTISSLRGLIVYSCFNENCICLNAGSLQTFFIRIPVHVDT